MGTKDGIHLQRMGSFFVGGKQEIFSGHQPRQYVLTKNGVPVLINPSGRCHVGQMYVQYFEPKNARKYPLMLWHGGSMSGACWESTPDGRPGWRDVLISQGWTTYVSDAVERGRSGWAPLDKHFAQPPFLRTLEDVITQFRIGTAVEDEQSAKTEFTFPESSQFPLESIDSFLMQFVPRWAGTDELIFDAYLALLEKTGPSVVIAHSQGGAFAFRAAQQYPHLVKALVVVEPSQGGAIDQVEKLRDVPVIAVFGDLFDTDARSQAVRANVDSFLAQLREVGGVVETIDLPLLGITGNSHLLIMERNSTQIAELVHEKLVAMGL